MNCFSRVVFVLAGILSLSGSGFAQPPGAENESPPIVVTRVPHHHHGYYGTGSARLVIHRIPNLGANVIVDLWIDGVPAGPIGYGHTFEADIAAGPHVFSLLPTPSPTWKIRTDIPVNVRGGETYHLTARGDHSGHLILSSGSAPVFGY